MIERRRIKDAVNRKVSSLCGPGTSERILYTSASEPSSTLRYKQDSLRPRPLGSHSENLTTSTLMRDETDPSPLPPNTRFAETFLETKDGFMAIV